MGPEWERRCNPVMTCYKLVTVEFKWWGLQSKVEKFIHKVGMMSFQIVSFFSTKMVWNSSSYSGIRPHVLVDR